MLSKFVDEKFPKWAKILLCIFGCAAGVYRIFNFVDDAIEKKEQKRTVALICGIICVVLFPLGIILGIIDLISICGSNQFSGLLR